MLVFGLREGKQQQATNKAPPGHTYIRHKREKGHLIIAVLSIKAKQATLAYRSKTDDESLHGCIYKSKSSKK